MDIKTNVNFQRKQSDDTWLTSHTVWAVDVVAFPDAVPFTDQLPPDTRLEDLDDDWRPINMNNFVDVGFDGRLSKTTIQDTPDGLRVRVPRTSNPDFEHFKMEGSTPMIYRESGGAWSYQPATQAEIETFIQRSLSESQVFAKSRIFNLGTASVNALNARSDVELRKLIALPKELPTHFEQGKVMYNGTDGYVIRNSTNVIDPIDSDGGYITAFDVIQGDINVEGLSRIEHSYVSRVHLDDGDVMYKDSEGLLHHAPLQENEIIVLAYDTRGRLMTVRETINPNKSQSIVRSAALNEITLTEIVEQANYLFTGSRFEIDNTQPQGCIYITVDNVRQPLSSIYPDGIYKLTTVPDSCSLLEPYQPQVIDHLHDSHVYQVIDGTLVPFNTGLIPAIVEEGLLQPTPWRSGPHYMFQGNAGFRELPAPDCGPSPEDGLLYLGHNGTYLLAESHGECGTIEKGYWRTDLCGTTSYPDDMVWYSSDGTLTPYHSANQPIIVEHGRIHEFHPSSCELPSDGLLYKAEGSVLLPFDSNGHHITVIHGVVHPVSKPISSNSDQPAHLLLAALMGALTSEYTTYSSSRHPVEGDESFLDDELLKDNF